MLQDAIIAGQHGDAKHGKEGWEPGRTTASHQVQLRHSLPSFRFNQCYGVLGVLDHLHGTDIMFKQTKAYERHVLLLGFTPLSESIPDPPKKMDSPLGPSRVFPHK